MTRTWILGVPDAEMEAIEAVLREYEQKYGYATARGKRVGPESAYAADGATVAFDEAHVVLVECGGPIEIAARRGAGMTMICPNYAPEYLAATSLRQVLILLVRDGTLKIDYDTFGWGVWLELELLKRLANG